MPPFVSFLLGAAAAAALLMFLVRKRIRVSAHQALLVFRRGLPARVALNDVVVLPFWEEVEFIDCSFNRSKFEFS